MRRGTIYVSNGRPPKTRRLELRCGDCRRPPPADRELRGTRAAPTPADRARIIAEVRWAMAAGARRAKCFEQSLAAHWLLRRRGIAAKLHYGVAKASDQGLSAHVWLRAEGDDIVGCENSAAFTELARFPAEA